MSTPIMNLNEAFYCILISNKYTKMEILNNIKDYLEKDELIAVWNFLNWLESKIKSKSSQMLFSVINFYEDELLNLSIKILKKEKNDFIKKLVKMLIIVYKKDFVLWLKNREIKYIWWKIIV